jgi:predicted nucleotidyltransferase
VARGNRTRRTAKSRSTKSVGRTAKAVGESGWADLFASHTLARLLTAFVTRPQADFYQKELADAAGTGLFAVQRELARLERLGLVTKAPRGNRVYYQANRSHPAFEDLKRLVLKTMALGDALRAALAPLSDRVRVAFVYGSFARGDETAASDVDLLMVGDLTLREASAVLGPVGRDLGRELNTAVYPEDEFRAKIAEGHHFLTEVLKGEKIYLIGDDDALEGLAG